MDITGIVLQGLAQATSGLEKAASRIAAAGEPSVEGAGLDVVDLSVEVVALVANQSIFDANMAALKTANEVQKSAIDLLA